MLPDMGPEPSTVLMQDPLTPASICTALPALPASEVPESPLDSLDSLPPAASRVLDEVLA